VPQSDLPNIGWCFVRFEFSIGFVLKSDTFFTVIEGACYGFELGEWYWIFLYILSIEERDIKKKTVGFWVPISSQE
jgi:hypothetical protein